jgi:Reverse transcriptase (RNA-dependent DNA polymerase)
LPPLKKFMWWTLEKKIPTKYVALIKYMYINVMISIRICDGESNAFTIKIELHQGSILSPYIFTLVMDEVTKEYKKTSLGICSLLMMWC